MMFIHLKQVQDVMWTPFELTHWAQVAHICTRESVIIGPGNGVSSAQNQSIIWTNDEALWIGP